MADFIIEKNSFDMRKLSAELEEYCKKNNTGSYVFSKILTVTEEYLANILFPNFDGAAELNISSAGSDFILAFSHKGADFTNKITDDSFLSLKILQNKTKGMKSSSKDGLTCVEFTV